MRKSFIFALMGAIWIAFNHPVKQTPDGGTSQLSEVKESSEEPNRRVPPVLSKTWNISDYHENREETHDSPLGKTIVYSFSQSGIPIVGMNIRVREQADGSAVEEENTYRPISEVFIEPELLQAQLNHLKAQQGRYDFSSLSMDSLVILVRDGMESGELAFAVNTHDKAGSKGPVQLLIRTEDGKILRKSVGRKEF